MNGPAHVRTGPTETSPSQREELLQRLREAGGGGVLAAEFYDDRNRRYGRSPRNRISELRAIGHKISGEWESKVDYGYTLIEETEAPKLLPEYNAQRKLDWYERQTGHSRPPSSPAVLGPLFEAKGVPPK